MSLPLAGLLSRLFRKGPAADLHAAAGGDGDALARLYDAHVDGLYAFVFHRVGRDQALAEDIVQETFTCALARTADYDGGRGSVASWLTTLSRNVIRDHLRAHRRSDEVVERWDRIDASLAQLYDALARTPLPGDVLERVETRDLVTMTIAHLPETYRLALARKYVDDRSLEDLAAELGVTPDAAKSLLARARRAFKETFSTLGHALEEVTP
ncbi:MAG: sigma-70 family RNA polymerase sigma factor [Kofleriaceae bacterium]|nr:sigma-70 family RNA polymerase sigma factor [Kofleriaceae bacterium]MCL4227170.1 sigma-70 family RNA polymerase sigma factor [Myxococcales bacterium]